MSILDFQKKYDTEDKCHEYFIHLKFPNGFKCPHCGGTSCGEIKTRNLLRCKTCRKQISVTSGTVFHGTHLSLLQIIWAIYLFANDKRGCSAVQIQRNLKVNYDTALYLLQRLRKAMKSRDDKYMLQGMRTAPASWNSASPIPNWMKAHQDTNSCRNIRTSWQSWISLSCACGNASENPIFPRSFHNSIQPPFCFAYTPSHEHIVKGEPLGSP